MSGFCEGEMVKNTDDVIWGEIIQGHTKEFKDFKQRQSMVKATLKNFVKYSEL